MLKSVSTNSWQVPAAIRNDIGIVRYRYRPQIGIFAVGLKTACQQNQRNHHQSLHRARLYYFMTVSLYAKKISKGNAKNQKLNSTSNIIKQKLIVTN
jgi:hypothetical protein